MCNLNVCLILYCTSWILYTRTALDVVSVHRCRSYTTMMTSALESLWKRCSVFRVIRMVFSESCAVKLWWSSRALCPRVLLAFRVTTPLLWRSLLSGEHQKALTANRLAQDACGADTEGQKDLLQQCERFQTELQESKGNVWSFSTASATSDRSGVEPCTGLKFRP